MIRLYLIKPWRPIPYAFDHTYLSLNEISELFLDFNQLWRYQSQKTNKSRVSIEIIPYRIVSFYRICYVEMLISIQIIPCHIVYTKRARILLYLTYLPTQKIWRHIWMLPKKSIFEFSRYFSAIRTIFVCSLFCPPKHSWKFRIWRR